MLTGLSLRTFSIFENAYVCSVAGELETYTVSTLQDELTAIEERGGTCVIADLMNVTFIDSAGMKLLLAASSRLRRKGGDFVVVSNDPRTLRVFEVTGSERQIRLERSLAKAVNMLAAQLSA